MPFGDPPDGMERSSNTSARACSPMGDNCPSVRRVACATHFQNTLLRISVPAKRIARARHFTLVAVTATYLYLNSSDLKVQAQEALRASLTTEQMARTRRNTIRNRDYNLALGPVDLLFDTGVSLEWNDNVRLQSEGTSGNTTQPDQPGPPPRRFALLQNWSSAKNPVRKAAQTDSQTIHSDPESDFILRPNANMQAVWPITELNTLYFSMGAAYQKYFRETDLDRFTLTPESHTAFDIYIGNVALTFYDRFSFNTDPLAQGSVSGVGDYGRLENTAGLSATWTLNDKVGLSGGYSHQNSYSTTQQFEYTDHTAEMFWVRSSFEVHPAVTVGLDSSFGLNRYDQNILNDSVNYTFGGFAKWKVTDSINAEANVGYSIYDFDQASGSSPVEDVDGVYFDLVLSHIVNRWMSHQLNAGRTFSVGINSDLQDLYHVQYTATLQFIRNLALNFNIGYELGKEPFFLNGETYNRYLLGAGANYQIMTKLSAGLTYHFTTKSSDTASRDYDQNQVTLFLTYRF